MDRGRAAITLDSHGHAATGRKCCKTLVRDDRRSQDFTLGTLSRRNANTHYVVGERVYTLWSLGIPTYEQITYSCIRKRLKEILITNQLRDRYILYSKYAPVW